MIKSLMFLAVAVAVGFAATSAAVAGAERGAIKRFVRFPVVTFELSGMRSSETLEESDLPAVSEIYVSGYWAGRSLLLIEFDRPNGREETAHYVHFDSVEMVDQARWERLMSEQGNLVCLRRSAGTSRGTAPGRSTAATKGFKSPC